MMYCQACGHQMHEQATACPSCGKPNTIMALGADGQGGWFSFRGRISRKVFWLHYMLPITAIGIVVGALDGAVRAHGVLSSLSSLILVVPQIAASVKRLHDRAHTGWLVLAAMIPIVGWLWFLIEAGCLRGTPGPNRFGADPIAADRTPTMRPAPSF